jgi:16S rRNA (uracil1498-N3)-methyltransferase
MLPRLYVPLLDARARTVELPDDEAGHLRRVLRVKTGAEVRLFDGRGHEYAGRVTAVGRAAVVAEIGEPVVPAPEWGVQVTLAQAVLKGDKTDDVIRDAVMMGVSAIQPMLTARTDVPAAAFARGGRLERWHRIAVSSAKQCGRAVVPAIHPPRSLAASLDAVRAEARLMLVEPAVASPAAARLAAEAPASALVLVGPEGGWADEEVALALGAGCQPLSLGLRTLRADAAPIVALGVLQHVWREAGGRG